MTNLALKRIRRLLEQADALLSEAKRLAGKAPAVADNIHDANLAISEADAFLSRLPSTARKTKQP